MRFVSRYQGEAGIVKDLDVEVAILSTLNPLLETVLLCSGSTIRSWTI